MTDKTVLNLVDKFHRAEKRLAEVEVILCHRDAQIAQLRDWLVRHGRHSEDCSCNVGRLYTGCTCGLMEALSQTEPKEKP